MARPPRPALGQGVNALFGTKQSSPTPPPASAAERTIFLCPIHHITPQPQQPRRYIDQSKIDDLAESIKANGLIEPIVVRRVAGPEERYQIIAGERRWRASQQAGHTEIQVVVKSVTEEEAFALALIENIQREELNPIELAEAYHRLLNEFSYTHDQLGELVRKGRTTITNTLRLLKLPERVRDLVVEGKLTEGHARTILSLEPDIELIEKVAETVQRDQLSVRQTEAMVNDIKNPPPPAAQPPASEAKPAAPKTEKTPAVRDLEESLQRFLGAKVQVRDKKGKGQIVIAYGSLDELDRVLKLIHERTDGSLA